MGDFLVELNNMKIYLIRHGESVSDIENLYGGTFDDELTERGQEQAQELAKEQKLGKWK